MENLKEIFKNVNDWLKYAEAKNGILLGFNGAVIFGILKLFSGNPEWDNFGIFIGKYYHYGVPFLLIISTIILLVSFLPKTKMIKLGDNKKPDKVNVLFFSHLKTLTPDELLKELGIENSTIMERSYAQQIVINSGISAAKFDSFKVAGWITTISILFLLPGLYLLMNYYKSRIGKEK